MNLLLLDLLKLETSLSEAKSGCPKCVYQVFHTSVFIHWWSTADAVYCVCVCVCICIYICVCVLTFITQWSFPGAPLETLNNTVLHWTQQTLVYLHITWHTIKSRNITSHHCSSADTLTQRVTSPATTLWVTKSHYCQTLTDFQNSFTSRLNSDCVMKGSLKLQLHLKRVAYTTLRNVNVRKPATIYNNYYVV